MAGISLSGNRNKATQKLLSCLISYMFEQEFGEMRNFTQADKDVLDNAKKVLSNHLN